MYRSLYVHVPFCFRKCDYCAFYSLGSSTAEQHDAYLKRIQEEFRDNQRHCQPLQSVFIGGGTPTALSPDELSCLLTSIKDSFILADNCEWTCECTPDSLSDSIIAVMAEHGVNRVSIGIQSFHEDELTAIGRRSSIRNLEQIVGRLRRSGIGNINFDFIFLIPGQTPETFADSLHKAVALAPTHVSTYALTREEHSILAKRLEVVDDTFFEQFWDTADTVLGNAGLHRYEISNFSREGFHCKHNDDIWHGQTYLGCGPAATSFDGTTRYTQPANFTQWLNHVSPEQDCLSPHDRACEILAFGMRTLNGWKWSDFTELTGYSPTELRAEQLKKLHVKGLIELDDEGARPTRLGLLFNDDVLAELI
ncbi:MAG: radical SAM family heme chaperone HemW [Victivallales bacterium]|nr:radical SAM family heme chaperone HemW [Victivallales bacterium]